MHHTEEMLFYLADYFANNIQQVQGAGGNLSVKSGDQMYIKASGFTFSEIRSKKGYASVQFRLVAEYFKQATKSREEEENLSLTFIADHTLTTDGNERKASMETGFHAVLGKIVVHTHSVICNTLTCHPHFFTLVNDISGMFKAKVAAVPYVSPGYALSKYIGKMIEEGDISLIEGILLLQNHGVIVYADTVDRAIELLEDADQVVGTLTQALSWKTFIGTFTSHEIQDLQSPYLFPDQVIYFPPDKPIALPLNEGAKELAMAVRYLRKHFENIQYTPQYLAQEEIGYLMQMEMEKHRKKLQKI